MGNIWMTTIEGLTKLNPQSGVFSNYSEIDGLPKTYFYTGGICYSRIHNHLYLATANGLAVLDINKENIEESTPTVLCSSMSIAGVNSAPSTTIRTHEKDSRLVLNLSTQNYGHSDRIRYAYSLNDEEWVESRPGENSFRFNNFPPGEHRLLLKATNELGQWSEENTEINLKINPYFHKTIWFYMLIFLLIVLIIHIYLKVRTAQNMQEASDEKISFFTNITHELRTPVTLIQGPIQHAMKLAKDEQLQEQLQIAERNSSYLLSLINELMDFRKIEAENVVLSPKGEDFQALLEEWLLPFRAFAGERNIKIRSLYRLESSKILLDAGYMRKVMVNLISNAIKFTPNDGCITIYIAQLKDSEGKDQLYINVRDNGYGIVDKDKERIFDRFYQSHNGSPHPVYGQSGTGIGLFLCRKIIESSGGKISAKNNKGQGSSFRILMPLIKEKTVLSESKEDKSLAIDYEFIERPDNGTYNNNQECILIVEDNKDMRGFIRSILQKDYFILEAENGKEALAIVHNNKVDLIISDLMMPEMDGMEFSRRIKEKLETSHIPLLMLTAIKSEEQEKQSYEIGVDEYLCKPFDEEVLRLRIRNMMNLQRRYREVISHTYTPEKLPIREESRDKVFMTKAIELMKENYSDADYTLDNFVRDMGYSKTLVNKKLQDLTGLSIGVFMKNYRLDMSIQILQKAPNDINVSELAYSVGFNDPKYFTKCFKAMYGYLPSNAIKHR